MLAALLIVFREVFEAGLIVGIVLAATEGVARRGRWIAGGIAAGLAGAALVAAFADGISNAFAGSGQEAFNATILIAAVAMLSWHNIWMSAHAAEMSRDFKSLGQDVATGNKTMLAMAVVVAIAILREGSEVVLFLFGIAAAGGDSPVAMLAGGFAGLAAGAAVSWLVYRGLAPVQRITDAVSRVSEKQFQLSLEAGDVPTELVPIVDKLRHALGLLEAAFTREKQAAADISHELRTPISALLATTQWMFLR